MFGPNIDDPVSSGIIPRLIYQFFSKISMANREIEFTIKVGYCEIYLERIKDLLEPSKNNLRIKEKVGFGFYIEDLTLEYVVNESEIFDLMRFGNNNREIAATLMNEASSRSHTIFIIQITQTSSIDYSSKSSKLYLVDLAGSEKVSKTQAEGKRLDEAKTINKSLTTLGIVINALTEKRSKHVPYRDSKLTKIL